MGARLRIKEGELVKLGESARGSRLRELARAATGVANGEVADLERAIMTLEATIGRTAADARTALAAGTLDETAAIVRLLMLDRQRQLLSGR